MRTMNIGICSTSEVPYPDFISEYIFDMNSDIESNGSFEDILDLQASLFVWNLRNNVLGAIRINIYTPVNAGVMLVSLLRAIYCTLFEVNIYHYNKDSDIWIPQNFQYVPEKNKDTLEVRPHTICDAYY